MTAIYLVRHGESTWNAEKRWAGHANPPLSKAGGEQTRAACRLLADMSLDGIASSTLLRACETAEIVADVLKVPPYGALSSFDERHAGEISGLTSAEIEEKYPTILDQWRQGDIIEIPGGEPWEPFSKRVIQGFSYFKDCGEKRLLLVTHEGVLRAVANYFNESHKKHGNLQGRWVEIGAAGLNPGTDDGRLL